MNISFFEILILLFILWPFLKKLFDSQKKAPEDNLPQQKQPGQTHQSKAETPEWEDPFNNWDDAFKDLEEIFTGNKSEPEPEEFQREADPFSHIEEPMRRDDQIFQRRSRQEKIDSMNTPPPVSENPFHYEVDAMLSGDDPEDIVDEGNPIFQDIDEETAVVYMNARSGIDVTRDLRDNSIMRNAIVIKEVLDRPLSKRETKRGNYARSPI